MKRGGTDKWVTRIAPRTKPELHPPRAGTNFVNDLGGTRATNLTCVPFTTRHGSLREELCVITGRSVASGFRLSHPYHPCSLRLLGGRGSKGQRPPVSAANRFTIAYGTLGPYVGVRANTCSRLACPSPSQHSPRDPCVSRRFICNRSGPAAARKASARTMAYRTLRPNFWAKLYRIANWSRKSSA